MSWTQPSKNTASGTTSSKIEQESPVGEIQTPDGQQILVGENEDKVLVYDEGYNNWSKPVKQTGSWEKPTKIV